LLDGRQLAFSHSWETEHEDRSQLRARVIGGCSAHNACVVLEGTAADYDEWGPGWTAADLRPYLDRAREAFRVRRFARDELSPWHGAFADVCGEDAILHPANAVGRVRWNAAFAYLDAARSRPNLAILADTLVDRIEPGCVVTDRGDLQAATIVLAAGAYGSPILLRSGLGDALPVGEGACSTTSARLRLAVQRPAAGGDGQARLGSPGLHGAGQRSRGRARPCFSSRRSIPASTAGRSAQPSF
jgi:choline dehydrogenase